MPQEIATASRTLAGFVDVAAAIIRAEARVAALPKVYPGYIAVQVKKALKAGAADPEQILRSIGDLETVGDCRYALTVTDFNGQTYRITIEVSP